MRPINLVYHPTSLVTCHPQAFSRNRIRHGYLRPDRRAAPSPSPSIRRESPRWADRTFPALTLGVKKSNRCDVWLCARPREQAACVAGSFRRHEDGWNGAIVNPEMVRPRRLPA